MPQTLQTGQSSSSTPATVQVTPSATLPVVNNRTIGVLLPLTGKFEKFGKKCLQGIQLAFDPSFNLVVQDSGEDPDQAIRGLEQLVKIQKVSAVIGPMLNKGSDQITQHAQKLGIPLLSLVRRAGSVQDFVFQAGLTQNQQTQELARYVLQNLKMLRFAILYPNDKMGKEMANSFWNAVESFGGEIVGFETYEPEETDFRVPVDKLAGLFYLDARQTELDALAQERLLNTITKKTRKTEQFFNLKPIVDFDAVFIPDEPKVAGQMIPTFAYRDIETIKFLGTASWNTPEFLSRLQTHGKQTLFVDAFRNDSESPAVQAFIKRYQDTYQQEPTSFEALAFDAGQILRQALTSGSTPTTAAEVRDRLKGTRNFPGVTGQISYKDGEFFRNLSILTLKDDKISELKN